MTTVREGQLWLERGLVWEEHRLLYIVIDRCASATTGDRWVIAYSDGTCIRDVYTSAIAGRDTLISDCPEDP